MGKACSKHERDENAYRDLVKKPEGKRPLEDLGIDGRITGCFKMDLRETGWKDVD
jgi:hypothetical protein